MSYIVLARKWRPQRFDELVGQDHIAQTLTNAISSDKICHGYLFTGTRGIGKTSAARILTKALNCEKGPTPEPCGTCDSCKAITSGNSMDVLEIDGASNRGVDDIRELREQVKYAPMQGKFKVYIIDEVHMLTKEAFNALLKTLEEPPPNVVFIFATTEIRKVPQTIQSRVQRFDFKRISEDKIRERLEFICSREKINPGPEALEILSVRAGGSMRDALSLFDQVYAFSGQKLTTEAVRKVLGIPPDELYDELFTAIKEQDKRACFLILDKFYDRGIEILELLNGFGQYLRNVLYTKVPEMPLSSLGMSESRCERLRTMGDGLQDGDILRYGKVVSDLLFDLRSAPNPRLTLEMGLARMASLDRVVHISRLLNENPSVREETLKKKTVSAPKNQVIPESGAAPPEVGTSEEEPPIPPPPPPPPPPEPSRNPGGMDDEGLESVSPTGNDNAAGSVTRLNSLSQLIDVWPDLISEIMEENPMLAGRFLDTFIEIEDISPPLLKVVFKKEPQFALVSQDKSCQQIIRGIINKKLEKSQAFQLEVELRQDPQMAETEAIPAELSTGRGRDSRVLDEDELVRREPIIGHVLNLFDGKLVD
ncbi:DNA polymerase III subunit gamma/tau [Fibrobacterota bacterium]